MTERPILFNDAMVRAILDGRKTQTRRPVKRTHATEALHAEALRTGVRAALDTMPSEIRCPFGAPGDLLWVRECWAPVDFNACDGMDRDDFAWCTHPGDIAPGGHPVLYRATAPAFFEWNDEPESRWRPSIHMPRWASRLTLRVTDVRVERVQDLREQDARAEGVYPLCGGYCAGDADAEWYSTALGAFADLWCSTYGVQSWTANPWVWVVTFERVEAGYE